ncbi:hypothetical protein N0V95_004180 [Ascochyta clinopodiicola]|nr:hypothetical protein N0V95_004180 [Ascochyta clinopodiicola]
MLALETPQLNKDRASKARAFAIAAAKIGQVPLLESILNSDPGAAKSKEKRSSPIDYAVARGQISAVQTLLAPSGHSKDQSTEPSREMHQLVRSAAKRGFLAILEKLLEYDPNATIDREVLINSAFINGHSDMVRYFSVVQRIDIDPYITPLHLPAACGYLKMVEFLLDYGVQHDVLDYNKDTALHLAARKGHLKVVEALLSHGAQYDVLNSHAETPLLVAFWNKKLDIIRVLSGYDDTILESHETYLQATSLAEVAQRLLDKQKISISSRGHAQEYWLKFRSLLYLAAESGDLELARLVLNHQDWDPQDVNMRHSEYSWRLATALRIARHKGHTKIAQLLIEHGASDGTQKQQEQPIPIRVEPDHLIGEKSSEMQEDMDSTSDSDLEEQPYSYIDEYMNFDRNEPSFTAPDEPEQATQNTQTWMSTVLG